MKEEPISPMPTRLELLKELIFLGRFIQSLENDVGQIIARGKDKRQTKDAIARKILGLFGEQWGDLFRRAYGFGHSFAICADEELPMESLFDDHSRYDILWDINSEIRGRILLTDNNAIFLNTADQPQQPVDPLHSAAFHGISLHEYSEDNLDQLSELTFSSTDLLDRLFCAYVIKSARDGHRKARSKIDAAFKNRAHKLAEVWYRSQIDSKPENRALKIYISIDDVKSIALRYAGLYTYGEEPETMPLLLDEKADGTIPKLNRRAAENVIESVNAAIKQARDYFDVAYTLYSKLNELDPEDQAKACDKIDAANLTTRTVLDPLSWLYPRMVRPYNEKIFRLAPIGNIVSWLFGSKTNNFSGRIWLELLNLLKLEKSLHRDTLQPVTLPSESEIRMLQYRIGIKKQRYKPDINPEDEPEPDILPSPAKKGQVVQQANDAVPLSIQKWVEKTRQKEINGTIVKLSLIDELSDVKVEARINGAVKWRQIHRIVEKFIVWARANPQYFGR